MSEAVITYRVFSPLDHYDYTELDLLCICDLCVEWRERLHLLLTAQKQVETIYKTCTRTGCSKDMKGPCDACRAGLKLRSSYIASLNRRDLYSECSFHADDMEYRAIGEAFMAWVTQVLEDRKNFADGWWVRNASVLPVQYWLTMFRRSVTTGMGIAVLEEQELSVETLPKGMVQSLVAAVASGTI